MSTIYIVSDSGKLQKKQDTLQHFAQDGTITKVFPYKTEQLVILGNVEMTGPALKLLMHHNVDTVFMGKNGRFNGKLAFQQGKNVFLRKKQYKLSDDISFKLSFSKSIVSGKLKNQLSFMQRIRRKGRESGSIGNAIEGIKKLIDKVPHASSMNELRGLEGMGARYFFSVFKYNIIQDWAVFNGRSMHPPQDNVNAVLSFLYTMIFYRIDGLLQAEDIDSYVGYLHELTYGKMTLAYDLMEEYRTPIADTLCCALYNRATLEEEDFREVVFSTNDDEFPLDAEGQENTDNEVPLYEEKKGVLLTKTGLKKVISQFEKKLDTDIYYQPLGTSISYKRVMREQIRHFKRVIQGEEEYYKPLVIK